MAGDRKRWLTSESTYEEAGFFKDSAFMGRKGAEELTDELKREESGEVKRTQRLKPLEEGRDYLEKPITREDFEGIPSSDEIMHDIDLLGLRMGLFSRGVDFLIDNNFPGEIWQQLENLRIEALAKTAAQILGLQDYKPLIHRETRTPEQQQLMLQIAGREQMARFGAYQKSAYFAGLGMTIEEMAEALNVESKDLTALEEWDDISDTCAYLNRYFFAIHKEINPSGGPEDLPADAREELREIVLRVVSYKQEHGGSLYAAIAPALGLTADNAKKLTEITQQGYFDLPLSKAWRVQKDIAANGKKGRDINVGQRTSSGAVIVAAAISGKDGEPLALTELEKGVQRAIGNLICDAGGNLPIIVSPQQIYRAFARLSSEATVTQQQADEIEKIMDALMYAESSLDFRAQLEKHKKIKQQEDYDYQDERSGKLRGPLVPAQKLEGATARDGSRVVAYKILAWPVFYQYSHIVGQIARIPNTLLTGPEKKPSRESKKAETQNTARNIAMKQNILSRVERMKEREKHKKTYASLIRVAEVASDCGITLTRQTERTLKKNIALYLDELKHQTPKVIKDYEETKELRKIVGFTIKL